MRSDWKIMRLSDIAVINPRESIKRGQFCKKIPMDKLRAHYRDIPGYVTEPFSGGTKFKNGDTIMARITPCLENGKIAKVNLLDDNEIGFGSTEYIIFRAIEGKSDEDFLYYLITSPLVREPAIKSMVGSSGRQRVQTDVVQNLEIAIPGIDEQRAIGRLLCSIDDKIAANDNINQNLLDELQAIYTAWFCDYIPFNGEQPKEWSSSNIYAIANIIYGAPFSSKLFNTAGEGKPIIRIRDLKDQHIVTYTTELHPKGYLLRLGDIVVGMDGEFRPYIWANEKAWLNQRVCVFENKRPLGKAFLYCTIKPLLYAIEQTQVATTVIHIGKKDFDAFEIILPSEEVLSAFDKLTAPMVDQIVAGSLESIRLTELRDTLLPRLMSGELDVSSIDN